LEPFDINSEDGQNRLLQLHRNAQVGACVSGVTHDINNMLGAAMAYAELVSYDEGVSDDSKKMLNQIVDGITKCSQLITSLTSIARKERIEINLTAPFQLMDEVLTLRDYELKTKRIKLERHYEDSLPTIPTDMPKMKLALIFLLTNAQEALSEAEDKRIKVTLSNLDGGVCFAIWDSGPGLTPEQVTSAFKPLHTGWRDGESHLGFGLYSARQIAEFHGGSLRYTPEEGFQLFIKRNDSLLQYT
tara:strand:+ start:146 stop:880 length:735 start_codon:yes stop_codon:yes gene_type:complete